ncbi:Gfo/Idh/MocA family oxidoreductase [Methylobacterium sp. C25]|uniref:Gfo/Idh/MocA family oxidoreductase n=1 Tax=Methylobacterium sp. C25 TaxID=2721622 RepID=UPI003FA3B54C
MRAAELDHMAECILQSRKPHTPGEEGLQDQMLMEAIYESAKTGAPVKLKASDTLDAFRGTPLSDEE